MNAPAPSPLSPASRSDDRQVPQPLDDEIDLLALIKAILATWKAWLLAVVVASVLFVGFQAYAHLVAQETAPYTKVISLTFSGVDRGEYPNGAPYRIQDIIAPAVLQSVHGDLGLSDYGLSLTDLSSRITVEPYTPYYREIMAKYDTLVGGKNQSFEQVQAIEERKRRELNSALSSAAIITFDPVGSGLPEAVIANLLGAIPLEWARQAIADKGVLKSDVQLVSDRTLDRSLFVDVDYTVLGTLFAEKIKALRENIAKVQELAGSVTARDPESGWTLRDLEANLHDLETYKIEELMSPIRSLGLSRNPEFAVFYFEQRKIALSEQIDRLEEEGSFIQAAYNRYNPKGGAAGQAEGSPASVAGQFPGYMPSLSGEVIEKLLTVAGDDSVEKYRQVLNDRWLETKLRIAELKSETRTIDRLIDAVRGADDDALAIELREKYLQEAEARIPEILDQLREYYRINERIYDQISRERVGSVGYLYKDGHQGVLRAGTGLSLKRTALLYIALMAAITFVVVPLVMIRNAMKQRGESAEENHSLHTAA